MVLELGRTMQIGESKDQRYMEQALVLLAGALRARPGGNNRWCDHNTNKGESY